MNLTLGFMCLSLGAEDTFVREVAPILEMRCLECHGGERPKGELSLETRAGALAGGRRGPSLVPGDPRESLLMQWVSGEEPRMPKGRAPLLAEEIDALRHWIESGAPWPEAVVLRRRFESWWSLAAIARPPIPEAPAEWARNPIDAFVWQALKSKGLRPSAEADRRTLLRRLTFDLHGLPPTPEELEDFQHDARADAYERVVERLLASPRYGERFARHWLDVVHFGETHGYDKDKPRLNAWPYRDYVIRAFNADKPYARFVQEQLAGDVLFPDDPDGVAALGFIAAGPWDFVGHVELREGTVDKDITRNLDRDDMVMNAMSTFASVTVHCARCHDHKFDPIPQIDAYRLQAVFAGVDRADRPWDPDPSVFAQRRKLTAELEVQERKRCELEAAIEKLSSPEVAALSEEMDALKAKLDSLPELESSEPPSSASLGYHSEIAASADVVKWVQVDLGRSLALQSVVLLPAHVAYGGYPGPGFGFPERFRVELSDDPEFTHAQVLADHTSEDVANPGNAPVCINALGASGRYVRVTATQLWPRTGDFVMALAEILVFSEGVNVARERQVDSLDSIELPIGWGRTHLTNECGSRGSLSATQSWYASLREREELEEKIQSRNDERSLLHDALIPIESRRDLESLHATLARINAELQTLPEPQKVYALTSTQSPRPIHRLERGGVQTPMEMATPAALSCLPSLEHHFVGIQLENEAERRRALAAWLTDPSHPLTWRSIVNRLWHYHFGRGLVETPNDFGHMGAAPTHPELLDWLARWFLEHGGSMKELHRLIVTSATYRQVSTGNAQGIELDAGNQFLWRMNRRRLEAEALRDTILDCAGDLDLAMGGPSVQWFEFKDDHSPRYEYADLDLETPGVNRRSIYRFLVRSVPDPWMDCLDCADPSLLVPRRNSTLTALQALALLNDRLIARESERFARRLEQQAPDLGTRINLCWSIALSRAPDPNEKPALLAFATQHGLANLCRLVFNLSEFSFIN